MDFACSLIAHLTSYIAIGGDITLYPNETFKIFQCYLSFTSIIMLGVLSIIGSAGGGGGAGGSGTAPTISNLQYDPHGSMVNDNDGSVDVEGSVDFTDPDGDIASYVLTTYDSSHNVVTTLSDSIPQLSGITAGNLMFTLAIDTTVVGDFSFEGYLIDVMGNQSNVVSGTFPIITPITITSTLTDTGIDKCYDNYDVIICPASETDPYYGQDRHYFSIPRNFTNNGDNTVTDNTTSLMWQQTDDTTTYNWFEATGTEDTEYNPSVIDVCGSLILGGYNDWRLPERRELESIVHYDRASPAIDTSYFSGSYLDYWSATESSGGTSAWKVYFENGMVGSFYKINSYFVRCVRGATWGVGNFIDNANGTISDLTTGLMWQKSDQFISLGDWQTILAYCKNLSLAGHTDWRLPDIHELESVISGIPTYFTVGNNSFCSSTTVANDYTNAWRVSLNQASDQFGSVLMSPVIYGKNSCNITFCVR
jgi:hypothetical protein